jgi:hypothetical protein
VDSEIVAGVIGAVLGAVFTAGGTWWVSIRLDRQRENRRLIGAIRVVTAELGENRTRIDRLGPDEAGKHLTLGDWDANKAALAGLLLRNEPLWDELVKACGQIYEGMSEPQKAPAVQELDRLTGDLIEEQEALREEIRAFSRVRAERPRW